MVGDISQVLFGGVRAWFEEEGSSMRIDGYVEGVWMCGRKVCRL